MDALNHTKPHVFMYVHIKVACAKSCRNHSKTITQYRAARCGFVRKNSQTIQKSVHPHFQKPEKTHSPLNETLAHESFHVAFENSQLEICIKVARLKPVKMRPGN